MIRGTNYIRPPKRLGRKIRNRPTGWNRRALQIKIDAACEVDTVGIQVGKAISLGHAITIMALRQTRFAVFQGENASGRGVEIRTVFRGFLQLVRMGRRLHGLKMWD